MYQFDLNTSWHITQYYLQDLTQIENSLCGDIYYPKVICKREDKQIAYKSYFCLPYVAANSSKCIYFSQYQITKGCNNKKKSAVKESLETKSFDNYI